MTMLSRLSKLWHGQHQALFMNGFPLTARLAWGCRLPKDPDLQTWLSDPDLFERHGNGVVLFAPRLLACATHLEGAPTGRLKGIMRWRHAQNSYAYDVTAQAIAAFGKDTSMMVAAGWADVSSGRATLASAHLARTFVALDPYAPERVSAVLAQLGWTAEGPDWRHTMLPNGKGVVRLSIVRDFGPASWLDTQNAMPYASGPRLALLLAEQVLTCKGKNAGQLIERMVQELPDHRRIEEARVYANETDQRDMFEKAFALVERLCGGMFEAQSPDYAKQNT